MKLALHQLRLEICRGRVALVLYGLILLGNFAVVAGWVGLPELEGNRHWRGPGLMSMLLVLAFWIALAQVVIGCVVADSPARRDRFLATRPLSGRALFGGKALYLLLGAVLPAVVLEVVSLATAGAPTGVVILGGFERFLLTALVAAALAAFAAHWSSTQATLFAAAACFGGAMLLGRIVLSLWMMARESARIQEPTFLTALQAVVVMTAAMAVTAWWKSRHGLGLARLIPAFAVIFVIGLIVSFQSPFRGVGFRGGEQAALDAIDPGEAIRIVGHKESSNAPWQGNADLSYNCAVQLVASGFPEDWDLRWRNAAERWSVDGTVVKDSTAWRKAIARTRIASGMAPLSGALIDAIQDALGQQVLFVAPQHGWFMSSLLSAGQLRYEPGSFPAGTTARLESEIAVDAFRWRVHANLPVESGAFANGWKIAGVNRDRGNLKIHLVEEGIALQTAGDPAFRFASQRWRHHHRFALFLPSREVVLMGGSNHEDEVPGISGAQRAFGTIEFDDDLGTNAPSRALNFEGARILILRDDYLGRLVTTWESPDLVLHAKASERQGSPDRSQELPDLAPGQIALWFRDWEKSGPDGDPAAVHRHLDELLAKVTQAGRSLQSPQEPAVIYASRFVPQHLDWMLERMLESSSQSRWFLLAAITQGADESQRGTITAAIPQIDALTKVAVDRGWLDEPPASPPVLLAHEGSNLRYFLATLVAKDDPEVDRQILDSFRRSPSPWSYDTLRQIPRFAKEVETMAHDSWSPGHLVVTRYGVGDRLQVALSQGRIEALEEFYMLIRHHGAAEGHWQGVNVIPAYLRLPGELKRQRHNDKKIMAWVLRLGPSDFKWDPVFRQFVPISANESI